MYKENTQHLKEDRQKFSKLEKNLVGTIRLLYLQDFFSSYPNL